MGEKLSEGPSSQDYVSLEISKKRGLSINPDIHHSKVPSSGSSLGIYKSRSGSS